MRHDIPKILDAHPELKLKDLSILTRMPEKALAAVVGNVARPCPEMWEAFLANDIPLGNLLLSEKLPKFGFIHDHTHAAEGPLGDFRRYVANVLVQAIHEHKFVVITKDDIIADLQKQIALWKEQAEANAEKLGEIRDIVVGGDEEDDW